MEIIRNVGDVVWAYVHPSVGPNLGKVLGMRRGVVRYIARADKNKRRAADPSYDLYQTVFDVDVNWYDKSVLYRWKLEPSLPDFEKLYQEDKWEWSRFFSRSFYYGIYTKEDLAHLLTGRLLGCDGFDEPQSDALVALHPLFQKVLNNPEAPYVEN